MTRQIKRAALRAYVWPNFYGMSTDSGIIPRRIRRDMWRGAVSKLWRANRGEGAAWAFSKT